MKKGLSFAAISALAISTVVAAPAATDASATTAAKGFYDTVANKYYTVAQFNLLTQAEKKALITKPGFYLNTGSHVISGTDAIVSTNAQLSSKLVAKASFTAANLDAIFEASKTPPATGDLKVESVSAINGTVTVVLDKEVTAATVTAADLQITQAINAGVATTVTPTSVTLGADKKTVTVKVAEVAKTNAAQSVVFSVGYKNTAVKTAAAFTVDATTAVSTVSATNGTVTVVLDKEVTTVVPTDFKLTQSINGAAATSITASTASRAADKKTVTLAVPQVAQVATEQSVVISAAYNETTAKSAAAFKVTAQAAHAVESVTALNAKQVAVTFTQDIAASTLKKSNFVVSQEGDAAGTDRLSDSATATGLVTQGVDAKTVILTVDEGKAFTNGKVITVKTSGIKVGEQVVVDATKTATLSDVSVPTVVKATSTGAKEFTVEFSEPVWNGTDDDTTNDIKANNFTINDGSIGIKTVTRSATNPNAVVVVTEDNLTAGTKYKVTVNPTITPTGNVQDFSGYKVMEKSVVEFTHVANTDVATVTAEAKGEKVVRLTFSKKVAIPTNANIQFRYAYNASGAVKAVADTAVKVVDGSGGKQWDVTLPSTMSPGAGTLYIAYVAAADATKSNVIKDDFGNVVPGNTAVTFTITPDTVAPTATVTYKDTTTFEVQFSEAVNNADLATNYVVKDPKGTTITATPTVAVAATNKYTLTIAPTMEAGGNYTVTIKDGITDKSVNLNKFVTNELTVAVKDTKKPIVSSVSQSKDGDKIYVYYSEEMGTEAVALSNYRLVTNGGTAQYDLPTGTTITQNGSTVTITLPKTLVALRTELGATDVLNGLFVGAVKDKAGNQPAALKTVTIDSYSANFTATLTKSKLLSDKQVSFVVDRQLKSVSAAKITRTGSTKAATSAEIVNNPDGTATVTATFATESPAIFNTNLSSQAIDLAVDALTDTNGLTNAAVSRTLLADYAAPKIVSVTTKDSSVSNSKIDKIEVLYSEDLYAASVQDTDYTVEGYTITGVALNADKRTVEISVTEKGTPDTGATPKVTQVGEVQDAISFESTTNQTVRNTLGAQAAKTATDGVAPIILTAAFNADKTKITVTFSEAVSTDDSGTFVSLVAGDFSLSLAGSQTIASVEHTSAAPNQAVLTLSAAATDSLSTDTINVASGTAVYDLVKLAVASASKSITGAIAVTGFAGSNAETTAGITAVQGVDTVTFAGTWVASDTVEIDSQTLTIATGGAGAGTATEVKTLAEANTTLNDKYIITDDGAGKLTFTEKVGKESVATLTATKVSSGTVTPASTTAGVVGVAEKNTITVTKPSTAAAGTLGLAFNDGTINKTIDVSVTATDDIASVASKIEAALLADSAIAAAYNVTKTTTTVVIESKTTGAKTTVITVANK